MFFCRNWSGNDALTWRHFTSSLKTGMWVTAGGFLDWGGFSASIIVNLFNIPYTWKNSRAKFKTAENLQRPILRWKLYWLWLRSLGKMAILCSYNCTRYVHREKLPMGAGQTNHILDFSLSLSVLPFAFIWVQVISLVPRTHWMYDKICLEYQKWSWKKWTEMMSIE